VRFIEEWMKQLCWQPSVVPCLERLHNFVDTITTLPLGNDAKETQERARSELHNWLNVIIHCQPVPMVSNVTSQKTFILGEAQEFADQLTILMAWSFKILVPQDLAICLRTTDVQSRPSSVQQFLSLTHKISVWVDNEIRQKHKSRLSERGTAEYNALVGKIIKVARRCQRNQNLAATMAITAALKRLQEDYYVRLELDFK